MYADALIIMRDEPQKIDKVLRNAVTAIFNEATSMEDRAARLCGLLPVRHHAELRRVIQNVRTPTKVATWMENRRG